MDHRHSGKRSARRMYRGAICVALFAAFLISPPRAEAYTPESPEVVQAIQRALGFLAKSPPQGYLGQHCLVGMCFFKANRPDHEKVAFAIKEMERLRKELKTQDIYSLGIAIIFLCDVHKEEHRPLLEEYVRELLYRQKIHGGFGYDEKPTGDVSQTQYAALAMWSAKNVGIDIPQKAVDSLCGWILRVQDPQGGWGYQGVDPGSPNRVPQNVDGHRVTLSLTAAGLGTTLICADMLKFSRAGEAKAENGISSALKEVEAPKAEQVGTVKTEISREMVDRAVTDGVGWFRNNYKIEATEWKFYYIYGLERCQSFLELYYNRFPKEPDWYNDGVEYIRRSQAEAGLMTGVNQENDAVSTSFATLFLLRSARKAIAKMHKDLGDGQLTSGKGLPTDLANASVKRGKVVDSPLAGEVDDLVSLLDDPDNPELTRLLDDASPLKLDADVTKRTSQIAKLRAAVSSGNWEARMIAVRALGKTRDFDNVPSLLYAMTDPDVRVVQEADAALRFMSRKFRGVGLPAEPTKSDIRSARFAWQEWYLSIRPDAKLLD